MPAILIISPEGWHDHFVSKHHYAITLAKLGATVLFLNPPDATLDEITIENIPEYQNLFVITGSEVARGLRYYPSWIRRALERRWLEQLEQKTGHVITIVWLFENSRFFDMSFAGNRLKIYHQVDLNQDFNVVIASRTADICFCTTDYIKQKLLPHNQKTYKIHHGVDIQNNRFKLSIEQENNFMPGKVNVAYIGNLDMPYIDIHLLTELVQKYLDVSFHFIGGYREEGIFRNTCNHFDNITWWGKIDHGLIPVILKQIDIMLVIYEKSRYKDQANPHKLMEYLASGKTTVATYTDEYKDKRHLLEMVNDSDDFIPVFDKVIENLSEYNSAEKQAARIEYAQQHSYERQLEKIMDLLKKHELDLGLNKGDIPSAG